MFYNKLFHVFFFKNNKKKFINVPVGYFFDEVGEVPVGNAGNIVHNANGSTITQSVGEVACNRKLELAQEKIKALEEQLKLKDEIIGLLKGK